MKKRLILAEVVACAVTLLIYFFLFFLFEVEDLKSKDFIESAGALMIISIAIGTMVSYILFHIRAVDLVNLFGGICIVFGVFAYEITSLVLLFSCLFFGLLVFVNAFIHMKPIHEQSNKEISKAFIFFSLLTESIIVMLGLSSVFIYYFFRYHFKI